VKDFGINPYPFLTFPGEWVLVTAAAGGVGIAAVQLAKGSVYHLIP
jgi:NADPH:quinone reductase-like Zn-dependent oxidoreductase